jgi:hypothetical protein
LCPQIGALLLLLLPPPPPLPLLLPLLPLLPAWRIILSGVQTAAAAHLPTFVPPCTRSGPTLSFHQQFNFIT